ncbi:MAG TPA: DUF4870 domain-containing protein [Acidobacteriota bacterium]|nr:DUF4870 domain-containing protein [Acidobacteriota bacterium]HNT17129.1 DUF4870 domain-containing protein [Acidobacteriota bacterium]
MTDEVQNTTPPVPPIGDKPYDSDDSIHLFLSYFGIFALIPFFMYKDKRDNPKKDYVYFHARQGLAIAIVWFILWVIFFVIGTILSIVLGMAGLWSGLFHGLAGILISSILLLLSLLFFVIFLGACIIGWMKAFKGERYDIPGFSKIAAMFG